MFSMIILDRNSKISNIKVLCHGLGGGGREFICQLRHSISCRFRLDVYVPFS
jgi:predicted esterase